MDHAGSNALWSASGVPTEYRPLYKYLETRYADAVILTFAQVEDLLGAVLPAAALVDSSWWAGPDASGTPSPQACAWIRAHRIATVNVAARKVTFDRTPG